MAVSYAWQTLVFQGQTAAAATAQFDAWFGYGVEEYSLTRQRIRRQVDGSLHMYVSHYPRASRYEIHVTALMEVASGELP